MTSFGDFPLPEDLNQGAITLHSFEVESPEAARSHQQSHPHAVCCQLSEGSWTWWHVMTRTEGLCRPASWDLYQDIQSVSVSVHPARSSTSGPSARKIGHHQSQWLLASSFDPYGNEVLQQVHQEPHHVLHFSHVQPKPVLSHLEQKHGFSLETSALPLILSSPPTDDQTVGHRIITLYHTFGLRTS